MATYRDVAAKQDSARAARGTDPRRKVIPPSQDDALRVLDVAYEHYLQQLAAAHKSCKSDATQDGSGCIVPVPTPQLPPEYRSGPARPTGRLLRRANARPLDVPMERLGSDLLALFLSRSSIPQARAGRDHFQHVDEEAPDRDLDSRLKLLSPSTGLGELQFEVLGQDIVGAQLAFQADGRTEKVDVLPIHFPAPGSPMAARGRRG